MAYSLGDLIWNIKSNTSDFDKGAASSETSVKSLSTKMKNFGTLMKGSAVAGAIVFVTKKLYDMASQSAEMSDRVDKMSQKIGISREAFQEWDFILSQSGASADGLQTSVKTLSNAAAEAAQGTAEYKDEFDRLGISVTDVNGVMKDQETLFNEVFGALSDMEDQTQRTATASKLLGRSATELAPAMNAGSDSVEELRDRAHELGLVVNDEVIDAGVAFTDNVDEMKRTVGIFKQQALTPVIVGFNDWYDSITKVDDAVKDLNDTLDKKKVNEIEDAFRDAWQETQNFDTSLATVAEQYGITEETLAQIIITEGEFNKIITAQAQNFVDVIAYWREYKEAIVETGDALNMTTDELLAEKVALQSMIVEKEREENAQKTAIKSAEIMGERYAALAAHLKSLEDPIAELYKIWESEKATEQADLMGQRYAAMAGGSGYVAQATDEVWKLDEAQAETFNNALTGLNSLSTAWGYLNEVQENAHEEELARMEAEGASDEEIATRKTELAREDAKREKKQASFSAALSTAQAIIGFLANPGGFAGVALSLGAGAAGLAQIAAINSEPLPSYDVGTLRVAGDQQAQIHNNEMVLPASLSEQARSEGISIQPTGGGSSTPNIIVYIGSKKIVPDMIKSINTRNYGTIDKGVVK